MLRFVSDGKQGPVLGLGLSEGNLQRLAGDEPIIFDLAEFDLGPRLFVIAIPNSAVVAEARDQGADPYVLELSPEAMAELRERAVMLRELPENPAGLSQVLLIHGDSEAHILQALVEGGFVPPGTELRGWDQYIDDVDRLGAFGSSSSAPAGSWVRIQRGDGEVQVHHSDQTRTIEKPSALRSFVRRLAATPVFWLGLIVVFAAIFTGIIELVGSIRHRREQEANAPVPIPASELERRRLVDSLDPSLLEAEPGEEACPYEVWVPEPLGTNMVPPTDWIRDLDASEQLEQGIAYSGSRRLLDITPAKLGIAGLDRTIRLEPENLVWRRGLDTYATLVIESLEDAEIQGPIGDKSPVEMKLYGLDHKGTTQQVAVVPGRVRARLVVWGYAEDRFVCVSSWVEVNTPPVDFISTSNGDEFTQTEDPVLKARVETVIAAAITGRDYLRVVARR